MGLLLSCRSSSPRSATLPVQLVARRWSELVKRRWRDGQRPSERCGPQPVGRENPVSSCRRLVLVETPQQVASSDFPRRRGQRLVLRRRRIPATKALRERGWAHVLRFPAVPDFHLGLPAFTRANGARYVRARLPRGARVRGSSPPVCSRPRSPRASLRDRERSTAPPLPAAVAIVPPPPRQSGWRTRAETRPSLPIQGHARPKIVSPD